MSDKRKAMTAAVKGPKSESNLVGKLNEIARLCGEIGRGKEELSSYGTLLDGNHRLQIRLENKTDEVEAKTKEVADRDTTITTMKAERDKVSDQHKKEKETLAEQFNTEKEFLTRNFADQACRWKQTYDLNKEYKDEVDALTTRTTKAEADVRRLTTQLAKVDSEHQKATNGLRSAETELATLTKALQTKGLSLQLAQRKLEDAEAKLDMLKNEVGITTLNHKELKQSLATIASECHSLVRRYFGDSGNLSTALKELQDLELKEVLSAKFSVLLDAQETKYMYMAMAEGVISRTLRTRILRLHYVLDNAKTYELLRLIQREDPRKEALLRCQLASTSETVTQGARDLPPSAAAEVAEQLFSKTDNYTEAFQRELGSLFQKVCSLWQHVQRSHVQPAISLVHDAKEDWDETTGKYGDYDSLITLNEEQESHRLTSNKPIATLFPRIALGKDVIHRGIALWSGQNAVVAAWVSCYGFDKQGSQRSSRPQGSLRHPTSSVSTGQSLRPKSFSEHALSRSDLPPPP